MITRSAAVAIHARLEVFDVGIARALPAPVFDADPAAGEVPAEPGTVSASRAPLRTMFATVLGV